jgi:hypothetical protein
MLSAKTVIGGKYSQTWKVDPISQMKENLLPEKLE